VAVVMAPISFVSEHSETLVELDVDYRRVATVGTDPRFIAALAGLVRHKSPAAVPTEGSPVLSGPV
jgi:ferrochelatase